MTRNTELGNRNVGRNAAGTPARGATPKGTFLRQHAGRTPQESPVGRLASVRPADLVAKVDAPIAGDHSPSVSAVNNTQDGQYRITGRGAGPGTVNTTHENNVPTFQFNTNDFNTGGVRDPVKGSAAHTMYTSLREMHGAGERDQHPNTSSLLDTTRQAYSPYNAAGEVNRGDNGGPGDVSTYRVNVHAPNAGGPVLHRSNRGVSPLIAQTMINLHYRDPGFVQRPGPGGGGPGGAGGGPGPGGGGPGPGGGGPGPGGGGLGPGGGGPGFGGAGPGLGGGGPGPGGGQAGNTGASSLLGKRPRSDSLSQHVIQPPKKIRRTE